MTNRIGVIVFNKPSEATEGYKNVEKAFDMFASHWQHFFDEWEVFDVKWDVDLSLKNQTKYKLTHTTERNIYSKLLADQKDKNDQLVIFSPFTFVYDPEFIRETLFKSKEKVVIVHPNPFITKGEAHYAVADPTINTQGTVTRLREQKSGFHTVMTGWLGMSLLFDFEWDRWAYGLQKDEHDVSTTIRALMWQNLIDKYVHNSIHDFTPILEEHNISNKAFRNYENAMYETHPWIKPKPLAVKS